MVALAMAQQALLQFLAEEGNVQMLSMPLPITFLAQRDKLACQLTSMPVFPVPTWRMLLASVVQHCSVHTIPTILTAMRGCRGGDPMPAQPDLALALLGAAAAWPLRAAMVGVPELASLVPFVEHCWYAAEGLLYWLSRATTIAPYTGRMPRRSSPDALARCAVALLAFAQFASMTGAVPNHSESRFASPMQTAAESSSLVAGQPHSSHEAGTATQRCYRGSCAGAAACLAG